MDGYTTLFLPSNAGPLTAFTQPGNGPVVLFQHGLCGDAAQPAEVFPTGHGFSHAVLNCRGHGASPLGHPENLSIASFTDDLATLASRLKPVAVGGISLGAAMALRLAVTRPDLVPALILSRPAWVTDAAPPNIAPNAEVGALIAAHAELATFDASPTARALATTSPDNLASLRGFFARQPLPETAALLTRIAADGPGVTPDQLKSLTIPTLILGSDADHIHPMALAETLARLIPHATLVKLPPKGRDRAAHIAACQAAILHFLKGLPDAPSAR